MNNKLRNSLMVSVLAICGVVAGHAGAKADPVTSPDIQFTGTVSNMCKWSTGEGVFAGTLTDITLPTDKSVATDVEAEIGLACNGDADITVASFTQNSVPSGMTLSKGTVTVTSTGGSSTYDTVSGSSSSHTVTGPFDDTLKVNMQLDYTTAAKPGTYSYTTTLTATPK